MAAENLLTWQESDAQSRLAVTSSRVTWTDMRNTDDDIFISVDKDAAFFDGSFVHTFTFQAIDSTTGGSQSYPWVMSNALKDVTSLTGDSEDAFWVQFLHPNSPDTPRLRIVELDAGSASGGSFFNITIGVTYYIEIIRDETVGSFGEIRMKIYSDAGRTILLNNTSRTLATSKKDFRYAMLGVSYDAASGASFTSSGYSEDLDLGGTSSGASPTVSTQAPTDITATTATGNGTIADLGISSVTAHGVVWDTSPIDTSVVPGSQPNSTDEGAGSLGPFTSNITGLTAGVIYYKRAYATNSQGTGYGDGVQWKSGATYSVKIPGTAGVKGEEWHYVGKSGTEYGIKGTAVT